MNDVYLLTGGNMGDRPARLEEAATRIRQACGNIVQSSAVYETAAWGKEDQDSFLNQVHHVTTGLDPQEVLQTILDIEASMGRKRALRYGPRIIDIDILLYNNQVINLPGLVVPHPQLQHRRFALMPLAEIAGGRLHPVFHQSVAHLLSVCPDPLSVNKFS